MELTRLYNEGKQRQRPNLDLGTMMFGKVPPQAKDLETAILGALLIEKDAINEVSGLLRPECFYVEAHQRIYKCILSLNNKSQPIDSYTLAEELRAVDELEMIGGPYFLAQLTNHVVSSAHIVRHTRIILEKFMQREVIRICVEAIRAVYEDGTEVFELMDSVGAEISALGTNHVHGEMTSMDTALVQTTKQIVEWHHSGNMVTGVSSGYYELDKVTLGFQPGDLIILAARPGEGKTAFMLNLAVNAALHPEKAIPVAIWSLEMKFLRLCLRMLSSVSNIGLYNLQTGSMDDTQIKQLYTKGVQILAKAKIFFDDKAGATMQQVKAKARRIVRKEKVGMIFVDYLQLMKGKGHNREQEISGISRELKELAQELQVPIIALSQLSREVEKRGGNTGSGQPRLSDLRESGAIEQDADVVMFIWKPQDSEIAQDASLVNTRYIRVAKQRNGIPLTFDSKFRSDIQLFDNVRQHSNFTNVESSTVTTHPDKIIAPGSTWKSNDNWTHEDPFN